MAKDVEASTRSLRQWCLAAMLITLVAFVAATLLAELNHDEGWYLYAARQVLRGRLPHADFFFTQGQIFPLFYALFAWLWSPLGILGGRLFSALLTFTALCLASGAVMRCARKEADLWMARLLLWTFLGLNLWFVTFTTIPKAYALCILGIAAAFRLLAGAQPKTGLPWMGTLMAGVILGLLPGVRLSMGILLPITGLWLLRQRLWAGARAWLVFGIGGLGGLLLALGPDLLLWSQAFGEAQAFHTARAELGFFGVPGCLARVVRYNPLLVLVGMLLAWLWYAGKPALKSSGEGAPLISLWLLNAAGLALVHLAAPVPYDDYQVPTLFLLSMAIAAGFNQLPFDSFRTALAKGITLAALAITLIGSPLAERWVSFGQDRLWMCLKEEPDLMRLRKSAALVRAELARHHLPNYILTQDVYLAVEAGADLPPGYEMGPFMPTPSALPDPLPPLAAWSGYTFALNFPTLTPMPEPKRASLLEHWRKAYPETVAVVPRWGQQHTTLTLALRPNMARAQTEEPARAPRHPCPFHLCEAPPERAQIP